MTYSPIDRLELVPGLLGDAAAEWALRINGREIYDYSPACIEHARPISLTESTRLLLRWTLRRNRDLRDWTVRLYAQSAIGDSTYQVKIGGVVNEQIISTTTGWLDTTTTPASSGVVECELWGIEEPGVTGILERMVVYPVGTTAPTGGRHASGYARPITDEDFDEPIATEHIERQLDGPIAIARDVPVCVFHHLAEVVTVGGPKSIGDWEASDSTTWEAVGRGRVPFCDQGPHRYYVDVFVLESGTGAVGQIAIGSALVDLPSFGGTAGRWYHWHIDSLGPGPHDVRPSIIPGASNTARIATCQVWRQGGLDVP